MAHDVFISYSSKDKVIADAVCAKLEQDRIRVWIAPRDVPAGANFASSIIEAVNACKVFVLIWSANTNASGHTLNEVNQAFDQGITIIPFRIQDVQPTNEMRYYFGRAHWLDAINPPLEQHIATLRDAILVNLGRELKPEAAPVAAPPVPSQPEEKAKPAQAPAAAAREKKREEKAVAQKPPAARPAGAKKFLPLGIGALIVVVLAVAALAGLFPGDLALLTSGTLADRVDSATRTPNYAATDTARSIQGTLTALDWKNTFAAPILSSIASHPPNFEDDFSTTSGRAERWSILEGGVTFGDGVMHVRGENWNAAGGSLNARDFVISFDAQPVLALVPSRFVVTFRGEPGGHYDFGCNLNDEWCDLMEFDERDQGWELYDQYYGTYRLGRKHLMLIARGADFAMFINGQPFAHVRDSSLQGDWNDIGLWSTEGEAAVDFDNVRFWDLNNLLP